MSELPRNSEHQPKMSIMSPAEAAILAERAHLAPESFDGAQRHTLRGDGITLDPRLLKPLGHNGPVAVIEVGEQSSLKVYATELDKKWHYMIADASFVNDDVEEHARVVNVVIADTSLSLGRSSQGAKRLGLDRDRTISGTHLWFEPENDQFRIQDVSLNGTKVTFNEQQPPGFKEIFDKAYSQHRLGGIAIKKPETR